MSSDKQPRNKDRAEALIYERYASFKKGAMRFISRLDGQQRGVDAISDAALYMELSTALSAIDVSAVLVRQKRYGQWLGCFSRELGCVRDIVIDGIDKNIDLGLDDHSNTLDITIEERFVKCFIQYIDGDVVVLVDIGKRFFNKQPEMSREITVAWFPVAATIREIFRQRAKSYGRLPDKKAIHDWLRVERGGQGGDGREGGGLGGLKDQKSCTTITISLDLRKSTFAMEQARDATRFATWMTGVISALTTLAQSAGAIFDKFTGDGVIIHFPVNPPWDEQEKDAEPAEAEAMERAVICAARMVVCVQHKLDELRKILLNDCGKFGAGVGIAIADAYWGVDLEGNPMVVGRGVVNACRAADPAPAGMLYLVNSAYQAFRDTPLGRRTNPSRLCYTTKEFNGDLDVSVWALEAAEVMATADHSGRGV